MVILHLSDIHFGRDNPEYKVKGVFQNKKQILQELLVSIRDNSIKPDHIIVTGDMAWYGRKNDFDEALLWFRELLNATKLSGSNLTFCPGNHDVNRAYGNYQTKVSHKDVDTIDRLYQYDQVHLMEAPLYNYEKFCEALGVTPYHYPRQDKWESSYAIGYKDVRLLSGEVFRIVSFNTALLSFVKNYPDDQMLIGQAQIRSLLEYGIIGSTRNYYTVALFHHAERFLHTQEICEYDQRYATLPLLRRYVDLVLCGHTETGGIPVLYKQIGGAEMLTGGAAYYSDDHANSYSMVIIPNHWPEGKEREVCLYPFIYSVENGWHHNQRKELPSACNNITADQPQFECRSDFELVFAYDDQRMAIPLKCVSVFIRDDNTALLSNAEDVCRNLDITCIGPTDKPGTSKVSISIATIKENSVEALLTRETVFRFLNYATKAQNGSSFKIMNTAGDVFLSGDNITFDEAIDDEGVEFLTKLRKIEKTYDVLFQCPKDTAESRKVDILHDLIERGYTKEFRAIPGFDTYSTDKKQLMKIGLRSLTNKPVYIFHKGTFRCKLYGNDFSLGNIMVLMGPYSAKGSRAIQKSLTFIADDQRKITLKLCDNSICYLITDEQQADAREILKNIGECVHVDKMNCAWDFIYEVSAGN